jgi:hypothetical protein
VGGSFQRSEKSLWPASDPPSGAASDAALEEGAGNPESLDVALARVAAGSAGVREHAAETTSSQ